MKDTIVAILDHYDATVKGKSGFDYLIGLEAHRLFVLERQVELKEGCHGEVQSESQDLHVANF